jgi:putative transposase
MSKRLIYSGEIYHVYNRGNQKMILFSKPFHYKQFIAKIDQYSKRFPVTILAYCIMPNHFHFLLKEPQHNIVKWSNISHFLHLLQTSHSKFFNKINPRYSGHVFQGTFKIKHVKDDSYLKNLKYYILHNPVRDGFVKSPEDWPYSGTTLRVDP